MSETVDTMGEFSGLPRRAVSFACGPNGCSIRLEGPSRALTARMEKVTDSVRDALRFYGLSVEEFLLAAEFCRSFDVMELTTETLDAALAKLLT